MAPLLRLVSLAYASALLASASAQSDSDSSDTVWAAVAFINHGETTPEIGSLQTALTPDGAQQMWRQGQAFRHRFLAGADSNSTAAAKIQEMQPNAIDNQQLRIWSQTDQWVVGGATAFLQGLYPPSTQDFVDATGGKDIAQNLISGSNVSSYPLDGYQYANIRTLSPVDSDSVAIQGTVYCAAWDDANDKTLKDRTDLASLADKSKDFYQTLFSTAPLKGTIDPSLANFWHAYDIYDYVNYMYKHNETVFKNLKDASNTLATLQYNALALESARNSDNTTSMDDASNILQSIAGRTLALEISEMLGGVVGDHNAVPKLTLMFGSLDPLMAFFSVGGLLTRENLVSGPFGKLPQPGAAMVFELIGENSGDSTAFPGPQDLRVRFNYRASANESEEFESYSLFGSGLGAPTFPYTAFLRDMQDNGKTLNQWCGICSPTVKVPWCFGASDESDGDGTGDSSSGHSSMSPAVAGVIGAVIMGALIGLVGLGLCFLGGFRVRRNSSGQRGSMLGGFKGPEKRARDTDVNVNKGGQRDERIGSWEMRDGEAEATSGGHSGIVTSDFQSRGGRRHDEEDGISMHAAPMGVREGF